MNSRRFTAGGSRASDRKDSTPRYGRGLLRCGISTPLMSAVSQNATSPFKARMSASRGSRHWSHTLTEARCFCSRMAERRRGLLRSRQPNCFGEIFPAQSHR
jgi:hypothetical protein